MNKFINNSNVKIIYERLLDNYPVSDNFLTIIVKIMKEVWEKNQSKIFNENIDIDDILDDLMELTYNLSVKYIENKKKITLKKQIKKEPEPDIDNALRLPDMNVRKTYTFHIDSRFRNVKDWRYPNRYRFNFISNGMKDNIRSLINQGFKLTNIIEIKLLSATFNSFELIQITSAEDPYIFIDLDEINGDTYTSYPNGKNVFGRMRNVETRTIANRYIQLDTSSCIKIYNDEQPFDSMSNITINLLNLGGDLFNFGNDGIPIISGVGNPAVITTCEDHGLIDGDRVYITEFNGSNNDTDVNRLIGHIVSNTTSNTFEIDVDLTEEGSGGYVIIAKLQHSLTFCFTIVPSVIANLYGKKLVPLS